jgi:hypothetical protein
VGHHRFANIDIKLVGKVIEKTGTTGPGPKAPEPDETDVRAKIIKALDKLDIGGGYELVDLDIRRYVSTPDKS